MLKNLVGLLNQGSTLKSRIFRNFIIFTIVPFLLAAVYFFIYTNQRITKEYTDDTKGNLNKCMELVNSLITSYIDKSSFIITNQYLTTNIQKNYSNDLEQMMYFLDNMNMIIGESCVIYSNNNTLYQGKSIFPIEKVKDNTLVQKATVSKAMEIIWNSDLTKKHNTNYLTFYRNIVGINGSIGVLEVNIPYKDMESLFYKYGIPENGLLYSTDKNGKLLYFKNVSPIALKGIEELNEDSFLIVSGELKNGHIITAAIPKREIIVRNLSTFIIILVVLLVYIALMFLASRITSQKIAGSLDKFISEIKENDKLLFNDELIQVEGNNEVSIIKRKFKELISRMNEIFREMMNIKLHNSKLEFELLQSRINPHLLYNSLSVITWNALRNNDDKTVKIIEALTKYYRTALNKGNSIIKISSELEMIREYVRINEYAHSIKYNLKINVEENVMEYFTLKHLLQPIVENSILHGFKGSNKEAIITINGQMEGSIITFEVIDNGRGMDQDTIDNISNPNFKASYGGYGIKNSIKRISAYYGNDNGISIKSEAGTGTVVTVWIEALGEKELAERLYS